MVDVSRFSSLLCTLVDDAFSPKTVYRKRSLRQNKTRGQKDYSPEQVVNVSRTNDYDRQTKVTRKEKMIYEPEEETDYDTTYVPTTTGRKEG